MSRVWRFTEEPKNEGYLALIDYAFQEADEFSFLIYPEKYDWWEYSEESIKLYEELTPYLTAVNEIKLHPEVSFNIWDEKECYFKANEETKEILNRYNCEGLFSWIMPDLMDDLCLYKEGKNIWISNVSHEEINCICEDDVKVINHLKNITGINIEEY